MCAVLVGLEALAELEFLQEGSGAELAYLPTVLKQSSSRPQKYSGHLVSIHNAVMSSRPSVDLQIICAPPANSRSRSKSRTVAQGSNARAEKTNATKSLLLIHTAETLGHGLRWHTCSSRITCFDSRDSSST